MTKFQKQMLTIAAAGALTAVTALPAMAFENEFHGSFLFNSIFSNYNGNAQVNGNINVLGIAKKARMNNYTEQRARIQYIAKASDDLRMVTQFEIDNQWGKSTATTATSNKTNGVGIDTDVVNIEVKHAYLDFNVGKSFNVKAGMQPYKDTLKGIFVDADMPALMTTTKMGAYTLGFGFSRYSDLNGGTIPGDRTTDLVMLDNKFAFGKDTKAALSYYLLGNSNTLNGESVIHTLGLSGGTKVAGIDLSGFFAMQAGNNKNLAAPSYYYHGWAANVAAKMKAGPGTARTGFLFVSGDNSTSGDGAWQTTGVTSYNESGLMILTRNTAYAPGNTNDFIRARISNQAVAYLGYDAKLTEKFGLDTSLGFAWVPDSDTAENPTANNGDFMGAEISMNAKYQLYKNLSLQAQAGYMFLGALYKDSINAATDTPQNPYTMKLQARYSF